MSAQWQDEGPDSSDRLVKRRAFVVAGSVLASSALRSTPVWCSPERDEAAEQVDSIPIIDTHIHLFDGTRPQGAPYTGPGGDSPSVSLPPGYRSLAEELGIVGAIKVEASPWIEDNLWALQVAQQDTLIVGVIGNLQPEKPEFPEYLDRFRKNSLFRGIRYGNLWGYSLSQQVDNPVFIDGMKRLAAANLVLDSANPDLSLLHAIVRLNDQVPELRIIIDHLPAMEPAKSERAEYEKLLAELKRRSSVYMKLSSVIHRVAGVVSTELSASRDRIDSLMDVFGEDRVIFGSDWPNSDGVAPLSSIVKLTREYLSTQPRRIAEKVLWRNSIAAYRWTPRAKNQPS
ncbi:MAG: amidohydrolase family protein [Aureliella sp.]